ncbi:MAG: DUF3078 domain-containing protein [Cytophagales bacterium]|nr:DUF3078 domain-containing protein [Cytophagales bacterium]
MRYITLLFLLLSLRGFSQESLKFKEADSLFGWTSKGSLNTNFANVGLNNWSGGGEDALSLTLDLDYSLDYYGKNIIWDNEINILYGLTRLGDNKEFRKTDDQFVLRSLFGRRFNKQQTLTFLAEFRTQLSKGFNYSDDADEPSRTLVSSLLAPGYLNLNLGWTLKKKDIYSVAFSPLTGKFTFVANDSLSNAGAFGVTPGKHHRFEGGANINGNLSWEIFEGVTFKLAADLFSGYRNPEFIDVNLRAALRMKVNKFLTSGISGTLIYDEDVDVLRDDGTTGPAVQSRYTINVGFALSL